MSRITVKELEKYSTIAKFATAQNKGINVKLKKDIYKVANYE